MIQKCRNIDGIDEVEKLGWRLNDGERGRERKPRIPPVVVQVQACLQSLSASLRCTTRRAIPPWQDAGSNVGCSRAYRRYDFRWCGGGSSSSRSRRRGGSGRRWLLRLARSVPLLCSLRPPLMFRELDVLPRAAVHDHLRASSARLLLHALVRLGTEGEKIINSIDAGVLRRCHRGSARARR
jgi:hypothetical protein